MKKLLIACLVIALMGGIGFAAGRFLLPPSAPEKGGENGEKTNFVLYEMPLGGMTFQVLQPERILHIVTDIDLLLSDAAAFERLGSATGRARLRDATIAAASDLAETTLWVGAGEEEDLDKTGLAEQIVLRLHNSFPSVHTIHINEFLAHSRPRQ